MTVWILFRQDWEYADLIGVFDSKAKAEASRVDKMADYLTGDAEADEAIAGCFRIEEHEVR